MNDLGQDVKKIVIIGGVAGGATALARLKRLNDDAEIVLFERGEYVSYANCGLPYYIGGKIVKRSSLLVQTPEVIMERFNVEVRTLSEVTKILPDAKSVQVKNLATGEIYDEAYDKLIISTGSSPLKPPIPGIDAPNVYSLWTIPDTDKIKSYIEDKKPQSAVVVGGGFIGLEMAENLHEIGLKVSIVEMADQVMAPIDPEMAQLVHNYLLAEGIDLRLGDGVSGFAFDEGSDKTTVTLKSGAAIEADMVILSIGVRPNSELAREAGLAINERGGIVVNESLETSDPNIYAIGDVIEVEDFVNKVKTMVPLAGPANKQGRIVANNIFGQAETYKGTQGTSIAKVFELDIASTGTNEKTLNRLGKVYKEDYEIALIHVNSNAEYYPGALPMTMKLIYDKSGKILGAQIVGYAGVDKRIDVLATAIRFGGTIYDLKELELAYAPPYSSAKDPVNMIGFVAENQLEGLVDIVLWRELENLPADHIILDISENEERESRQIEGSIHIPLSQLRDRVGELDKDKTYVTYCGIGLRGYIANRVLIKRAYKAKNLVGGYKTYRSLFLDSLADCNEPQTFTATGEQLTDGCALDFSGDLAQAQASGQVLNLDLCGLSCPGPIIQVSNQLKAMAEGEIVEVVATDPGFLNDIGSWCKNTGNVLIDSKKDHGKYIAIIKKQAKVAPSKAELSQIKDGKNLIVFSGDLDKAIASFIIANGARAMGKEVTMFFTFWGLNIIKKDSYVKTDKDFISKMFGMMMPKNSKKLGMSKMNMAGMGPKMIRMVMKGKNVSSLEELIEEGLKSGIRMVACQMSMDVMGIKQEELLDGVEIGGVAMMLDASDDSNMSLFI